MSETPRPSSRTRTTLIVIAAVLVVAVAAGWAAERRFAEARSTAASEYRVRVTREGRELASYDLVALQGIGSRVVVLQGSPQEGPQVIAVLRRSGVEDFTALTVLGTGERDSGRIELAASQVDSDTVLAIAKRGTVKIAGPQIPKDKRVRDVTEIQVR